MGKSSQTHCISDAMLHVGPVMYGLPNETLVDKIELGFLTLIETETYSLF